MKLIKWGVLGILLFMLLSSLALWSWGKFAKRAKGEPTYALPVQPEQTDMDRWIAPMLAQHPQQTGVSLLSDNLKAFAVRALTAQQAQRSIDVQYYLWHDDLTGRMLKDELLQAAERGVRVRMLIDDMNGMGIDDSLVAMASHPNIEVRLFNPARNRNTILLRALEMGLRVFSFSRRMHNKAWIVDGRLAIVGGRNIGNEYFDAAQVNFHDADLVLLGEGVNQSSAIFDSFWNSDAVIPITALRDALSSQDLEVYIQQRTVWRSTVQDTPYVQAMTNRMNDPQALFAQLRHHWVDKLQVLSDPPAKATPVARDRDAKSWLTFDILQTLFTARQSMWVISPYFVPGNMGVTLFAGMATRGVNVNIMSNSLAANDVPMVHSGYAPYRKPLLKAGVHLWELKPDARIEKSGLSDSGMLGSSGASLHTKAFVVDELRGFVGSFNFDPRSAALNTEMGVLFEHPELAHDVQEVFSQAKQPHSSYVLRLENDELRWDDKAADKVWEHEPNTTWPKRALTRMLGWLPLESQL